jgi:hypothetical protein
MVDRQFERIDPRPVIGNEISEIEPEPKAKIRL